MGLSWCDFYVDQILCEINSTVFIDISDDLDL